jgi:putative ATPase
MKTTQNHKPLPDRMRPQNLDEFVGQEQVVGKGTLLRNLIESDSLRSLIFWGPPGVGKTTLASIIAHQTGAFFVQLSAVSSGKADLTKIIAESKERLEKNIRTILFIDEIHRWSKSQQDALLPVVENGTVILIGATTENPSFEVIRALLSRSQVIILKSLTSENIVELLERAIADKENGFGEKSLDVSKESLLLLAELSGGDARTALNGLEIAIAGKEQNALGENKKIILEKKDIKEALQKTHLVFDNKGEEFYNIISALHKSMRGNDANAALYWLARMLEGGVDPLYVARRVIRFASEDIGMANSEALVQANAAYDAAHKIGMPECSVNLAQAVVYCAKSAKSNLLYTAYKKAAEDARNTSHLGVPLHIRNASTKFMKEIGYGKGYKYNPDFEGKVEQDYLPDELKGRNYLKK